MDVPGVPGALWLCGKHLIGADPQAALERVGAQRVICLTERHEIAERYPNYLEWLTDPTEQRARWFPIPDLHAPSLTATLGLLEDLDGVLDSGDSVILHCAAGFGRSGTLAAGALIWRGAAVAEAVAAVAAARPLAGPEAGAQHALLGELAAHLGR